MKNKNKKEKQYSLLKPRYLKNVIKKHSRIIIATDGGCRNKSGHKKGHHVNSKARSACGYRIEVGNYLTYGGKSEWGRTNNYQEIYGVLMALKRIKRSVLKRDGAIIISDSHYVDYASSKHWIDKWARNDWYTRRFHNLHTPRRKNWKLWRKIYWYDTHFNLKYVWVKGHQKNKTDKHAQKWEYMMNNFCDQYLNKEMDEMDNNYQAKTYQDKLPKN